MSESINNYAEVSEETDKGTCKKSPFIFVTGGTGLVGSNLIKELLTQGKSIRALYRNTIPEIKNKDRVEWIKGDILDIIFLEEALKNIDQVYHCAAIVSFDPLQRHHMFKTNVEGTSNVVNASLNAGVKKLCFVSSVAALGQKRNAVEIDESMSWSNESGNSNYGKSKYEAEMEVWRGIGEGLDAVIVNPSIILGAGNWKEGSSKIFKTAYEEFPWYTEGETGFVDVSDVVRIMVLLMESNVSAERFVISAENLPYKTVFTAIANCFGKKPPYKKVTPFVASMVWRLETLKSILTKKTSLLTKETAWSAQAVVKYNNSKLKKYLPSFQFTPIEETIKRVCKELEEINFSRPIKS